MRTKQVCNISLLKHTRPQQTAGAIFKYCPRKDISKPLREELSSQLHQTGPKQIRWCLKTDLFKYNKDQVCWRKQESYPYYQDTHTFSGLTQVLFALCSLLSPVLHTASPLLQRRAYLSSIPGLLDDMPPPNTVCCLARLCTATPDAPLRYNTGHNWKKSKKQECKTLQK